MIDFGIWIYPLVFFGETLYLLGDSLYLIYLWNKKAGAAAAMGFIRTVIWVIVTSSVIVDVQSDPLKVVCYCLGYVAGVLLAVSLEKQFSNGFISMRIVADPDDGEKLVSALRIIGLKPDLVHGSSGDGARRIVGFVTVRRNQEQEILDSVLSGIPNAFIYTSKLSEFITASAATRLTPFMSRHKQSAP